MIIRKLLVPLINDKILQNAEHCYIAAASITEPGFDLLMSRLGPKCKADIVTGLDEPAHPEVLKKIFYKYPNRVNLRIHTKSFFHSNVYIFDLPFRKMVAFISSGTFSMEGFRDNEELSYKVDSEKGVEELKSWFRSYYEPADALSERMVVQYKEVYQAIAEREAESKRDKKAFSDFVTGSFKWETARLNGQFFQEEDYKTFDHAKISLNTQLVRFERERVKEKLKSLYEQLTPFILKNKLFENADFDTIISTINPSDHYEDRVKEMWLCYKQSNGKTESGISLNGVSIKIIIRRNDIGIWLVSGSPGTLIRERESFKTAMEQETYRNRIFDLYKSLGDNYWIETAGEKRKTTLFKTAEQLREFTNKDSASFYFITGRTFLPNDPLIALTRIADTVQNEILKLMPLFTELQNLYAGK